MVIYMKGLYIISSIDGQRLNGQCANTAFQVTSNLATVAIGINKENLTHQFIEASGLAGISICLFPSDKIVE